MLTLYLSVVSIDIDMSWHTEMIFQHRQRCGQSEAACLPPWLEKPKARQLHLTLIAWPRQVSQCGNITGPIYISGTRDRKLVRFFFFANWLAKPFFAYPVPSSQNVETIQQYSDATRPCVSSSIDSSLR